MRIYLIIAIDKNGTMGKDNKLCWSLPEDLKHFKKETKNFPLIMGANTFNSLPGILPGREHLVLSNTLYGDENKSVFTSIKEALDYCEESNMDKVFVIGGANIIKQFNRYNLFDELIITHVDTKIEGDTEIDIYEDLDFHKWQMYETKANVEDGEYPFVIKKYIKKEKRFY